MFNKTILRTLGLCVSFVIVSTMTQCAGRSASDVPKDILGVSVGMNKEEAQNHLKAAGKLIREEAKRQEVWALKDGSRFGHLAVGYDKENRVHYVTAIAKPNGETSMKPDEIGSLTGAKQEINGPNYRYIWEVAARGDKPAYTVTVQGNQPESLSLYTISALRGEDSLEEKGEEERKKID